MEKYFITSDTHSFYTSLINELNNKGFDIKNKDHVLIFCGDLFDRGNETFEIYNFIKSIPQKRRILIRGNHEYLFMGLKSKHIPQRHDFTNGTVKSYFAFAGVKYDDSYINTLEESLWDKVRNNPKIDEIIDWFLSDEWIDYYETNNHIFTHAFIPLTISEESHERHMYFVNEVFLSYKEDWRNSTHSEFENATWGCPWRLAYYGLNQTGKMIVCGHWHTSDFFNKLTKPEKLYDVHINNPIFVSKEYKLIGLDSCVAATNKINVLVLNEDEI